MNQLCVYTYPLSHGPPFHPPWPPLPRVTTEHWAELPVLYDSFPLAIYFTHGSVYISIPFSWFIPSPPHILCPHICSLHLHLYSCPANSFTCTIFLDSTYMPWYTNFNKFILCSQKNVDQLWLWPPEGFDWQVFCPWWLPSSPLCLHHLGKWDLLLHIFPWKHWDDIWKMWRNQAIQEGRYITSRHLKTTAVHQCFPSVYMNIHNPTHQMSMSVSPLSNNYY